MQVMLPMFLVIIIKFTTNSIRMDIKIINYSLLNILKPKLNKYIREIGNITCITIYLIEKKGQKKG